MEQKYLNVHEQINYLKERNLQFNLISEKKAKDILLHEAYFHKILAYKYTLSAFEKIDGEDNFNGIDFNDLYELRIIDGQLRELFNDITLEIESYFKVFILRHIDENQNKCHEYIYYDIVDIDRIYRINSRMNKRIRDYGDYYSQKYLDKFPDQKPVWVLNEYLSFGEVLEIFTKYVKKKNLTEYETLIYYLKQVKMIRNITVHNNTLLMDQDATKQEIKNLRRDILSIYEIDVAPKLITGTLTNKLVSTLLIYKLLVPKTIYEQRLNKVFLELHTMIKTNHIFRRYPQERIIRELKYLYKMINRLY